MPAEWVRLEVKTKFFRLPDNSIAELKDRLHKATLIYKNDLEKDIINKFGESFKFEKYYDNYNIHKDAAFHDIDIEILNIFSYNDILSISDMAEDYCGFFGLVIPKEEFNPDDVTHFRLSTEKEKYVKVYPNIAVNTIKFTQDYSCKFRLNSEYRSILEVNGISSTMPNILRIQKVNETVIKRIEKVLNVMKCILEAYKEPYIKWKNNIIVYQKLEESLNKKFKILLD